VSIGREIDTDVCQRLCSTCTANSLLRELCKVLDTV